MKKLLVVLAMVFIITAIAGQSFAYTWTEAGDAGDMPGTAQTVSGLGDLTSITGYLDADYYDVDMYQIYINGLSSFSATTVGGSIVDTALFLFDSTGMGVLANDDTTDDNYQSTIPSTALSAGIYYLAISAYAYNPVSIGGLIFPLEPPWIDVFGPTGPGGASPISGWVYDSYDYGEYTITLTGVSSVSSVPEPSTILLFGAGMAGLAFVRRFRK